MQEEFLTRCVVDPTKKTVYLYSSEGSTKEVICETSQEFLNVLKYVHENLDGSTLAFAEPLVAS
jgi:hypothetical protein